MNSKLFLLYITIFVLFLSSCSKSKTIKEAEVVATTLYSNSFESAQDTMGVSGFCQIDLVDDFPMNGGSQSVLIACGCIAPHVLFDIGPFVGDHKLVLKFQAKSYELGGSASLRSNTFSKGISISINDISNDWVSYQSLDTLMYNSGELLQIELSGGGKGSGKIIVDLLEVVSVE